MLDKLRNRLLAFIGSDKDTPLLAGFAVGLYMMLFYYSKNFALANSWQQLLFFTGYYLLLPAATLFIVQKVMGILKLFAYRRHFLFTGTALFFVFFFLQLINDTFPFILFSVIAFGVAILSIWLKNYYKAFIPLLLIMCVFNIKPLAGVAYKSIVASDEWKKLPDDIESVHFLTKPNVYYIQPDGYTSFRNFRENPNCLFDNDEYVRFLKATGFTLYDDYRSNYVSTLLSNSATFAMKHHYIAMDVEAYGARRIITESNPVLRIFKNNGYKTSFITEKAYLVMNRPQGGYDYCNITNNELPYIKDGLDTDRDIFTDLKTQVAKNTVSGNFYFIEKFQPTHITNSKGNSTGIEGEKKIYMQGVRSANKWLEQVISFINRNDAHAIIIIGADHGGYTGLSCTADSTTKITDPGLVKSIFGAQLAIKWGNPEYIKYDSGLRSGVNLFRTLFSFLAKDKKYLQHTEENGSYIKLHNPAGVYRYIDDKGNTVFEKP
ncbi:sulfatase-like hydrolase/transferase [Flavobacterium sp.]|uniref:sulfatase-like hydrolase/transferase n=1 Tax=Flavobacterium sp. TaxID=239 RepID=UPI004034958A